MDKAPRYEVIGLRLPIIEPGADLARLIAEAAERDAGGLRDGDIVVVTSKVVLKARGEVYRLDEVRPSAAAKAIALLTGKNPVEVELILMATRDIVAIVPTSGRLGRLLRKLAADPQAAEELLRRIPALLIVTTRQGLIAVDGDVDYSNLPPGHAIAATLDFDEEARRLRARLEEITGKRIAVVISDTEFNATGKAGTVDAAVGSSGITPVAKGFAAPDLYGRPKFGGIDSLVDEAASAAALLMGQAAEGVPAVILRGLTYERSEEGVKDYVLDIRGVGIGTVLRSAVVKLAYRLLYRAK